jgi:hypothetical protein
MVLIYELAEKYNLSVPAFVKLLYNYDHGSMDAWDKLSPEERLKQIAVYRAKFNEPSYNYQDMKKIYVAGKFGASTPLQIEANIMTAKVATAELCKRGFAAFCPHMNTAFPDSLGLPIEYWYQADLAWLDDADAIFMLKNWQDSTGAKRELEFAKEHGLKVFYENEGFPTPADVPKRKKADHLARFLTELERDLKQAGNHYNISVCNHCSLPRKCAKEYHIEVGI